MESAKEEVVDPLRLRTWSRIIEQVYVQEWRWVEEGVWTRVRGRVWYRVRNLVAAQLEEDMDGGR